MIPVVGPILSAIPAIAVASTRVAQEGAARRSIFFLLQQQLENHILVPKIMSRQVGVSAVTVIVALLIGGSLLGIVGAILAVPTAAILQVVAQEFFSRRTGRRRQRRVQEIGLMRTDPLAYLGQELDSLREQKLFRQLRILEDEQKAHTTVDHRSVVNLSSNNYLGLTTHPRLRAGGAEGDRGLRRRHRFGADDRRHHGNPHGAGAPARRVQEGREGRRLSERLHGERRHGLGHPRRKRTSSSPTS